MSAWKQDVSLHCKRVGIPLPNAVWRQNNLPLEVGGRKSILPNATLVSNIVHGVLEVGSATVRTDSATKNMTKSFYKHTVAIFGDTPVKPSTLRHAMLFS